MQPFGVDQSFFFSIHGYLFIVFLSFHFIKLMLPLIHFESRLKLWTEVPVSQQMQKLWP